MNPNNPLVKEFVKLIFNAVHKRWYVEHAIGMIESEEHLKKVVDNLQNLRGLRKTAERFGGANRRLGRF